MLEVLSVSKSFATDVRAVRRVLVQAQAGQLMGIVGAGGSGKSTFMNLLAGLVGLLHKSQKCR